MAGAEMIDVKDLELQSVARAHEVRDVPPRGVGFALVALFAGIAASMGIVAAILAMVPSGGGATQGGPTQTTGRMPPPPRLEVHPAIDRAAIEAEAEGHLRGYAWLDPQHARARIPIERAMALTAQHGWPNAAGGTSP